LQNVYQSALPWYVVGMMELKEVSIDMASVCCHNFDRGIFNV
jgi:hypothetical protein